MQESILDEQMTEGIWSSKTIELHYRAVEAPGIGENFRTFSRFGP